MKRRYILYRRKRGGMFYIEDTETRKQESTGTGNRACAKRALMKIPSLEDYEERAATMSSSAA
jgi:hypothetical protein